MLQYLPLVWRWEALGLEPGSRMGSAEAHPSLGARDEGREGREGAQRCLTAFGFHTFTWPIYGQGTGPAPEICSRMEEIAEAWISEMEWECCASALVVWGQTQRYGPEPVPSPSQNLVLRSAPLLPVWSGVVTLTPGLPELGVQAYVRTRSQ